MLEMGLIEKLDPEGSKKSTTYIATQRGIEALPVICQMYLFSIDTIDESLLNDMQMDIKKQIKDDHLGFQKKKITEYHVFVEDLKSELHALKQSKK